MRARRGFTLVEVMVVVVIASLLGLGVAGTVSVALDTRQRVEARRLEVRSQLAWRAVVTEALRNTRPPAVPGDTALVVTDSVLPSGVQGKRLMLLTSGSMPPLNPGADWAISLEREPGGVVLTAAPVGITAVPLRLRAPGAITDVDIQVQGEPDGPWLETWTEPALLPTMVRVTFLTPEGAAGPPVTVRLPALEPLR